LWWTGGRVHGRRRQAISRKQGHFKRSINGETGFSLLEVLVVIGIISILAGILYPAMRKARRHAKRLLTRSNQRQIVQAVTVYAVENNGRFPDSVATIGVGWNWNWSEPTLITGYEARSPRLNRSMSAYLGSYINDVGILACPNAPEEYKNLQQVWDAADEWDNPETDPVKDPVSGNYCFYWNYNGYIEGRGTLFRGPSTSAGSRRESKLLVSDYFGYDHWRSQKSYGSCEPFKSAEITPGTALSSSYWSTSWA